MIKNVSKALTRGCLLAAALGAAVVGAGCERDEAYGVDRDRRPADDRRPVDVDRPRVDVDRDRVRDPEPAAPSETVVRGSVSQALDAIAQARCDRAARCQDVGGDKKYSSKQACVEKVKEDKLDGLNSEDCKFGIDQKELNECLTEIRNEDCNNPLDTLGRVAACRSSDMCKASATPGNQ
jgi:hypothetical protein